VVEGQWLRVYPYATWAYWSQDETEIGLTRYDHLPGVGRGDLFVYSSTGTVKFDLTGRR